MEPKTLLEAVRHFSDLDVCHACMVKLKWPDGRIVCPKCGGDRVGNIASRRMLQCKTKGCRKQFSAKVGTIFEDSPLGLDKWFVAVWAIAKNGISSMEVHRALGITQKTAWFMLHRIRLAMRTMTFERLHGVDEESWRLNNRRFDDGARFEQVMQRVLGRRITCRLLCAIDDAGFMGIS